MSSDTRRQLGFREEIEIAFAFLCTEFRFRLVDARETFLRYENDLVFVNAYHGRSSYEMSFEVGLLSEPDSKFYPEEIATLRNSSEEVYFQASTPDRVRRYAARLAGLLRNHGAELLNGDAAEFARLQHMREKRSVALDRRDMLSAARSDANAAWQRRDFDALIKALNTIGEDMSPAERMKLAYALSRRSGSM